jgi:DNA repair photolyase
MTLTTFDEELCKIIEPRVCTTRERFETLRIMRDRGIPTIVWLCPILPFINDTEENLRGILDYCVKARVYGIICFEMGLTLREGNREFFYENLDRHFPGLKRTYQKKYGNNYVISSGNNAHLMKIFYRLCGDHHIRSDREGLFAYLRTFDEKEPAGQLNLFESHAFLN